MNAIRPAAQTQRHLVPDGCPLTVKELGAIRGIAAGKTYQQIAHEVGVSATTIRCHLHTAYQRLGVPGSIQAVIHCFKSGWVTVDDISVDDLPATKLDITQATAAIDRLTRAIRADQKRDLTATQRAYLHAFDDLLYARDDIEYAAARAAMTQAFGPLLDQAGVPHRHRPRRDLVERLVAEVQANRRH